jgi:hypothetical protein
MVIDPVAKEVTPVAPQPVSTQAVPRIAAPALPEDGRALQPQSDQVQLSVQREGAFRELQLRNERSNSTADAIRQADRSLQVLSQKIDDLKVPLDTIVKNFPPFALEDQDRIKLMMKYSSLRKEIDQLTLPPPPEVVAARRAHALPAPLGAHATDSQIADHVAKLDAVGAALDGTRAGLAADTAALVHDGRFASIFSRPNGADTGLSEIPLNESAAAQKSSQVGQQFANVVRQGVTAASSQFLKGLS